MNSKEQEIQETHDYMNYKNKKRKTIFIAQLFADLCAIKFEWSWGVIVAMSIGGIIPPISVLLAVLGISNRYISLRYHLLTLLVTLLFIIAYAVMYNIIAKVSIQNRNDMRLTWTTALFTMFMIPTFFIYLMLLYLVISFR